MRLSWCEIPHHSARSDSHPELSFLPSFRRRDGRVAEGARLESVFTRKGNVGSNPTLSATQSELQRNSRSLSSEMRETCPLFAISAQQHGLERTDRSAAKGTVPPFLWR